MEHVINTALMQQACHTHKNLRKPIHSGFRKPVLPMSRQVAGPRAANLRSDFCWQNHSEADHRYVSMTQMAIAVGSSSLDCFQISVSVD